MDPVSRTEVPRLIPGAPEPESAHLRLALLWAQGELAQRRVQEAQLSPEQVTAVRTAVAAKALGFLAGLKGVVTLNAPVSGVLKIKVGAVEATLPPQDAEGRARVAAAEWDAYAALFLGLALPPQRGWGFPGAAR